MSFQVWDRVALGVAGVVIACVANAQAAAPAHAFNIPQGELKAALDAYVAQTGVQLIYRMADVQHVQTRGASGMLTDEAALALLLAGTPLATRRDANGIVVYHDDSSSATADDAGLTVVTVTAQKRPEAAQSVPISMSTFSARQLDTYRIDDLQDLSRLTPNLLVSSFSEDSPTIAIRGASNTFSQIGVNKPVAVVVDDVFITRDSAASFDLFDLDSINVLKGPQGTLFGRNVTGGAIVINTRKPSLDKPEAEAQLTAGNYDDLEFKGLLSVPIGEDAAAKLSTSVRHRDGTGVDRLTGEKEDGIDSQNVRGQLRLVPNDAVEVLLSADYSHDDNGGRALASDTVASAGDPRVSELGVHQDFLRDIGGGSARVSWDLGDGNLTSITAFRHSASTETYSGTGVNYQFLTTGSQSVTEDSDQVGTFSQEVRYASPKWNRGDFVAGVYFLDENGRRQLGNQGLAAKTGVLASSTLADQIVDTSTAAAFVDGTWHLASHLDLLAGMRYTDDQKRASLTMTDEVHAANSFSASGVRDGWRDWTPRLALDWQATRDALAYASITRGFTSGGFNVDASSLAAFRQTFAPETVTNYETGVKTQWLDNRLRFNLSVFDMHYKDKQELVFNTTTDILDIVNAARATIKGAELELAYKPASWANLQFNYASLDTRYDAFQVGTVDNTGHPLSSSPRDTYSLAADVRYPVARGYLLGSVNYFRTAKYNTGAANSPALEIPSYGLVNASAGYETPDHHFQFTAWAKNLANTDYILTRSTQGVNSEYLGEPRTFGVTLTVRY